MSVTGTGVPAGSRIVTIPGTTTVTIAGLQTATLAGNLTFGAAPMFLTGGGTFRYLGGTRTDDRLINLDVTGGALEASGTGALTLSSTPLQFTGGAGARTLTLGGSSTAANTLAAVIADNGGATNLVKNGAGTWVLTGVAGTYTGGVAITGGVLRLGTNNKALGDGFAVSVSGTGTLDVNAANGATATRRYDITASGSGVAGQAAIWNSSGTGIVNNPIYRSITLAGDASIGGVGRYDINGGTVDGTGVTFNGGTFSLTKVGANELWWAPNPGATVGNIIVNAGIFGVQSSLNLGSNAFPVLINSGGTLYTYGGGGTVTNDKPILLNSGIFGANNGTGFWTGTVSLNGAGTSNRIAPLAGTQVTLNGVVGGDGFEKQQPGTLELQNAGNNWVGDTKITAGTVRTTVAGALSPSTTLDMNGGTLDLFGTAQTAAGLKGATGTITGNGALNVAQAAITSYGGTITSSTALTKSGGGTLTLAGVNSFTGGTTISGGILRILADSGLGAAASPVEIDSAATLQAGGPVTSARAYTLGAGGGKIDTAGQTVTLDGSSSITGTALEKTGLGTLNVSSTQTYAALTTSDGITNIYTPLGTGTSTVTANATTNFYASQTLASLAIAAGVEVTFGDGSPFAPAPEKDGASASAFLPSGGGAVVPEPGSLGLLLASSLGMLGRRWRKRP